VLADDARSTYPMLRPLRPRLAPFKCRAVIIREAARNPSGKGTQTRAPRRTRGTG